MSDLFEATLQPFDIIIVAVIVVSAVMSLGRGLIREAFSVVSFTFGLVAAFWAVRFAKPWLQALLPQSWGETPANLIAFGGGFLLVYSVAAYAGSRAAKLIHASPEIGALDRLAGAAFGALRGVLAAIFFILLMQEVLPDNATPTFVSKARSYEYLNIAASWIRDYVPGFVARASTVIPETPAAPSEAVTN